MKKTILYSLIIGLGALASCNNDKSASTDVDSTMDVNSDGMVRVEKPTVRSGEYVNLSSGQKVYIIADPATGIAVDSITQIPVEFYYDPITLDTIYQNGLVVNRMLINQGDGKYKLDDMKIKIDGDEIKIKTDSTKIKMDKDTYKEKTSDGKTKITDDAAKMKSDDGKVKVTEDNVKVKPNN